MNDDLIYVIGFFSGVLICIPIFVNQLKPEDFRGSLLVIVASVVCGSGWFITVPILIGAILLNIIIQKINGSKDEKHQKNHRVS